LWIYDHSIVHLKTGHPLANGHDVAGHFMAEDDWRYPIGMSPVESVYL
jgi:hypothetical protein